MKVTTQKECSNASILPPAIRSGFVNYKTSLIKSVKFCRAGASKVVGVECLQHLCDVAAESVVQNGYSRQCMTVNKDIRRLTQADVLPFFPNGKADICIFEVRLNS